MKCGYCGHAIARPAKKCPHCGQDPGSGVYQTCSVLIAAAGRKSVYDSVAAVPGPLRAKMLKCTAGLNSGTILIADRRGRREIAKALRAVGKVPSTGRLGLLARGSGRRMIAFRAAVALILLLVVACVLSLVFLRR